MLIATVNAYDLRDALIGTSIAASRDDSLPAFCSVHIITSGDTMTCVGTDRYRLIVGTIDADVNFDAELLIELVDVQLLLRTMKRAGVTGPREDLTVSILKADDGRIQFRIDTRNAPTLHASPIIGNFPDHNQLLDPEFTPDELGDFHCNPKFLADFAKVPHSRHSGMRVTVTKSRSRLIRIGLEHAHVRWQALLMPIRLAV